MPRLLLLTVFLVCFAGSGCVKHKELINLREAQLEYNQQQEILNGFTVRIQPEDVLDIKVSSSNEEAVRVFNPNPQIGTQVNVNQGINNNRVRRILTGYRVDEGGFIIFPVIGRIPFAGLTLTEAINELRDRLTEFVRDAEVNIKFVNFRVTLIGEVNDPGSLNMPTDRTTIFEAIGQAGDMTEYANRKNVLILREVNGNREFGRLNLQSDSIFLSPYYYLSQNDVVYIEPLKVRKATVADPFGRALGYTTALISLAALIAALVPR